MSYKVITHNGKAHLDELLGCALLALHLGEEPDTIERIDSQEASRIVASGQIPDNTYFIDCGFVLDSGRNLFDHHQDRELDSAALLVFNEFFPQLRSTELYDYIKLVSKVDTKGPMSLDDFEVVSESKDYWSFSQKILLRTFEENPILVVRIFINGLEDKIQFEKAMEEGAQWLEETGNIEIVEIESKKILKYLKKPPTNLVSPIKSVLSKIIDVNEIAAILSFDDKLLDARVLYRTNIGHYEIDFSKSTPTNSIFNHQGGFLLKFVPSHNREWIDLVKESLLLNSDRIMAISK